MPHGIPAAANSPETGKKKVFGRPFQKGVSGNPSGRPKKKPITEIFEKLLESEENKEFIAQSVMETLRSRGMAKVLLLDKMADRIEGKVKDELEVSVDEGLADQLAKFRARKANGNG